MSGETTSADVAEILDQLRESVRRQQPAADASPGLQSGRWRRWELLFGKVKRAEQINPHLPIAWPEWPRGLLPKVVAVAQKLVRRSLRWYLNPIVEQQNTYNEAVTEALGELIGQITRLDDEVRASITRTGVLNQRLRRIEERPDVTPAAAPPSEATRHPAPTSPSADESLDYFMLELKYRGTPELIRERQAAYLPDLVGRRSVLDIGCGRGEFVELLRENGIDARGIDLDPDAVAYCQERGLPVKQAEAAAYLRGLEGGVLDGVFMAQVAEHLAPDALQTMLQLAFTRLQPGGILILETVNPLCLYALVNHYLIDPSHVRPLHPELARFMIESAGFGRVELRYLSPTPEEIRLRHYEPPAGASPEDQARFALMNQNVDRVNQLLFGYQDYAVLATRPPGHLIFEDEAAATDG